MRKFQRGDRVAVLYSNSLWPAKIVEQEDDVPESIWKKGKKHHLCLVRYYGEENYQWIPRRRSSTLIPLGRFTFRDIDLSSVRERRLNSILAFHEDINQHPELKTAYESYPEAPALTGHKRPRHESAEEAVVERSDIEPPRKRRRKSEDSVATQEERRVVSRQKKRKKAKRRLQRRKKKKKKKKKKKRRRRRKTSQPNGPEAVSTPPQPTLPPPPPPPPPFIPPPITAAGFVYAQFLQPPPRPLSVLPRSSGGGSVPLAKLSRLRRRLTLNLKPLNVMGLLDWVDELDRVCETVDYPTMKKSGLLSFSNDQRRRLDLNLPDVSRLNFQWKGVLRKWRDFFNRQHREIMIAEAKRQQRLM